MDVSRIVADALKALEKRTLGGVTAESAGKAIEQAVEKVVKEMTETASSQAARVQAQHGQELTKLQEQINSLTAQAKYTSVQLESAEKSAEASKSAMNKVINKFEKLRKGKPYANEDGNIVQEFVNRNGTVFRRVTLPNPVNGEERVVELSALTMNGKKMKTVFDPATGKKMYSITNGENLSEKIKTVYDSEGKIVSKSPINVKKVKVNPTIVNRECKTSDGVDYMKDTYSDGSYVLKKAFAGKTPYSTKKYNADGTLVMEESHRFSKDWSGNSLETITTDKYNAKGELKEKIVDYYNGKNIVYSYGERKEIVKQVTTNKQSGLKTIVKADIDEYGRCTNADNMKIEHIYPKTSKIKTSKVDTVGMFRPSSEKLVLRDGSVVELKLSSNSYAPYEGVLTLKNGSTKQIENLKEYLDEIGYIGKLDQKYFYNCID